MRLLRFILFSTVVALGARAGAQETGFSIGRYVPTSAGEYSFWVDHPWYSSTRWFAAGLSIDYAHKPLVFGETFRDGTTRETAVIEHHFLTHFDMAASFADRVTLSSSLPVTWVENGTAVGMVTPRGAASVGDPRLGFMIRLVGQPDRSPASLHFGFNLWIPIGDDFNSGDRTFRGMPRLVLAGLGSRVRYSLSAGILGRAEAHLNGSTGAGSEVGTELHFGALLQYADVVRRFAIGPEATVATVITGGHAFQNRYTSIEVLLGAHYNIANQVQIGAGVGLGVLREPGTPDARLLVRIAYAPIRQPKAALPPPPECPPPPPPKVCPPPQKPSDRDGDGVYDDRDLCPDEPMGEKPDGKKLGCPIHDKDGDGVRDEDDVCPDVPQGPRPDPEKRGCPLSDRDKDTIIDPEDACPDTPGAPHPDPKKNGCPGLVEVKGGQIVILKPVYFATDKDVILKKSFPVLQGVSDALKASPHIRQIVIEGHTDADGTPEHNLDLSDRRAKSVRNYLIKSGISPARLSSRGFGREKPIDTNDTPEGKANNRRVEFKIIDDGTGRTP
jgi:outer membrane protein OmpA-like peptidoglycan-associated protein